LESDELHDYENTELFKLFAAIIKKSHADPLRDMTDETVRKLMRDGEGE
jgi:hypothetical protein